MIIWEDENVKVYWDNSWVIWYKLAKIKFRGSTQDIIQGLIFMIDGNRVYMNLLSTDATRIKE